MHVLLTGVLLLGCAFLIQLLIWRIRLPKSHTAGLLVIFALTPIAAYLLAWPALSWELFHIALFYTSCTLVYINLYSLIEEESPTLSIITCIKAAPSGCTKDDLQKLFSNKNPLERRLNSMVGSGLLTQDAASYTLAPKGKSLAILFTLAARIIGLRPGG